jgi:hypothetical protein
LAAGQTLRLRSARAKLLAEHHIPYSQIPLTSIDTVAVPVTCSSAAPHQLLVMTSLSREEEQGSKGRADGQAFEKACR